MKYLTNYTSKAQTELFKEIGAFFAFSTEQFNKAKQEGVQYVQGVAGMIYPKGRGQELADGLNAINKAGIKQDFADNGRDGIIMRELSNHECYYTGDIEDCVEKLEDYGITSDEIQTVFNREWASQCA